MTEKSYQHFFGGMIGGMFGTFISHPIDTMRVRLQTNQHIITNINITFHYHIVDYITIYYSLSYLLYIIILLKTINNIAII